MTDPLTDAVKRLKQLQADVERLKAGQDEEGEPRLFIETQDLAVARDSIEAVTETAQPFYYNSTSAGYNSLEYPDS